MFNKTRIYILLFGLVLSFLASCMAPLGMPNLDLENNDEVLKVLREGRLPHVIFASGDTPEVKLNNQGVQEYNNEQYSTAESKFREAIKKNKDFAIAQANLAETLRRQALLKAKPESYRNTYFKDPRPGAFKKKGGTIYVDFSGESGDLLKEAAKTVDYALKIDPTLDHTFYVKSWILTDEGFKYNSDGGSKAIKKYKEALELNPGYVTAYVALAAKYRDRSYGIYDIGSGVGFIDPNLLTSAVETAQFALMLHPNRDDAEAVIRSVHAGSAKSRFETIYTWKEVPGAGSRSAFGNLMRNLTGSALQVATSDPTISKEIKEFPDLNNPQQITLESLRLSERLLNTLVERENNKSLTNQN